MALAITELAKRAAHLKAAVDETVRYKAASTALVRAIRAGKLSPETIERAAQAMPAGIFRYIKHLGRGQYNVADQVVGNVGGRAGEMVRKLPTHKFENPQDSYATIKTFVDAINARAKPFTKNPLIAPYITVNERGAFQHLGNAEVPLNPLLGNKQTNIPANIIYRLADLHPGNFGPNGQIVDFIGKDTQWAGNVKGRNLHKMIMKGHLPTRAVRVDGSPGFNFGVSPDTRGNTPAGLKFNNDVRRYYHTLTPAQRVADNALTHAEYAARDRNLHGLPEAADTAALNAIQATITKSHNGGMV